MKRGNDIEKKNVRKHNFNSREKRKFRYWGEDPVEIKKQRDEAKKNPKKINPVETSQAKYHPTDEKHKQIIKTAQALNIAGKHAGSKSTKKLSARISFVYQRVAQYAKAFKQSLQNKDN